MYEDTLSPRLELHRLSYGALELGDLEAAAAVTGIPAFGFKSSENARNRFAQNRPVPRSFDEVGDSP